MNPNNEFIKCAGQAPDGTRVCAYRNGCLRFVRPEGDKQSFKPFWQGGDDCPQYLSIPVRQ
jgi:hypothetical protein